MKDRKKVLNYQGTQAPRVVFGFIQTRVEHEVKKINHSFLLPVGEPQGPI